MSRLLHRAPLLLPMMLLAIVMISSDVIRPCSVYDFTPLTELVQGAVESSSLTGVSLLVVKDGQVIYEKTFGTNVTDREMPIASGSKWLSASVIMSLVDDSLISLDDPISRYLPSFTGEMGNITMRQLLSHTSGLPASCACLDDPSTTLAGCVEQIAQIGLAAEPGTKFCYGSVSFQVAGRIAEVVSGKPWATLFEERIKGPLGMTATSYGDTANPVLAGSATSTIHDYARLLQMQLDNGAFEGKRILSPWAVRTMQSDQTCGVPIVVSPHQDGRRYGLGVWLDQVDTEGNALQLSCQGDTGFSPWIDRRRGLVGIFMVDDQLGNVYRLVEQVQETTRRIVDSAGKDH